jgi:uncharacterized membrane protein YhaH (DUF805 family)
VKPFKLAVLIIASNHIAVADSTARAINPGILVSLIFVIIIHVFIPAAFTVVLRIRDVGAAEHGIVVFIVATCSGRRFLL